MLTKLSATDREQIEAYLLQIQPMLQSNEEKYAELVQNIYSEIYKRIVQKEKLYGGKRIKPKQLQNKHKRILSKKTKRTKNLTRKYYTK